MLSEIIIQKIKKEGPLTAAFGAMIGRQLEQMWDFMGRGAFTIVEYGAGTGLLCHDILDYLISVSRGATGAATFIITYQGLKIP